MLLILAPLYFPRIPAPAGPFRCISSVVLWAHSHKVQCTGRFEWSLEVADHAPTLGPGKASAACHSRTTKYVLPVRLPKNVSIPIAAVLETGSRRTLCRTPRERLGHSCNTARFFGNVAKIPQSQLLMFQSSRLGVCQADSNPGQVRWLAWT